MAFDGIQPLEVPLPHFSDACGSGFTSVQFAARGLYAGPPALFVMGEAMARSGRAAEVRRVVKSMMEIVCGFLGSVLSDLV